METTPDLLTSQAEIQRIYSTAGVTLRTDDLTGQDATDFWTEICVAASDTVRMYLNLFEQTQLINNYWVRMRATWIGAFYLSQRRANAEQYQGMYDKAIEELEKVQKGQLVPPRLTYSAANRPAMSNLQVDDRFYGNPVRVSSNDNVGTSPNNSRFDFTEDIPQSFY